LNGKRPLVSVVLPVYNGRQFLSQAIESILRQTFDDFELILVDDGSTDSTPRIIAEYTRQDRRVRALRQENGGLVAALNVGCSIARGPYLARMDADDVASPERLCKQVGFLDQQPQVGVLGAGIVVVAEDDRRLFSVSYPRSDAAIRRALAAGNAFAHPAVMMRASIFHASGGYRAAFSHAEDYDLWLRMSEHCALANLAEPLLRYRFHAAGVSFRNLKQQVVSMAGAELSAVLRRSGDESEFGSDPVTLETLSECASEREQLLQRVHALGTARAAFLIRVGQPDDALRLMEWVATVGPGEVPPPALAKSRLIQASAWYQKQCFWRSITAAAQALRVHPLSVLAIGVTGSRMLLQSRSTGRTRQAA
jgi:hypothetical protein